MSAVLTTETDVRAAMREIGAEARAAAARSSPTRRPEQKTRALLAGARVLRERAARNSRRQRARSRRGARAGAERRPSSTGSRSTTRASRRWRAASRRSPRCPIRSAACWRRFERPNGLLIERVATPLGVVGVIYESRPNVTADAGALCLKSGNAVVLRGGSDSFHSSAAIHACLVAGLREAGLPEAAISRAPFAAREAVGEMLEGLGGALDVIVPRGGKSLVERVQREARVPVFAHLEGVVHVYVDGPPISTRRCGSSSIPRCAAPASAARPRRCSSTAPPRPPRAAAGRGADRGRLRRARRRGDARCARRDAGDRGGLAHRISRRDHRRRASSTGSTRRSSISRPMARITPIASSPRTRRRPSGS